MRNRKSKTESELESESELVLYCNHCGNTAGHFLLCETGSNTTIYNKEDLSETDLIDCNYYLTKCKTCFKVSLYYDCEYDEHQGYITEAHLCYPVIKTPSEEIPLKISETYNEALRVEKVSYGAFALLIRRALELLCKDKNAKGKSLKDQLEDLAAKNVIPLNLCQMADTLRKLGNISAHNDNYRIDIEEVIVMKDFFIAMLEYVYVAPAKIEKLKQSINRKTNKSGQ